MLHYDNRSDGPTGQPVLLLIGSPMGAEGFGTLTGHFTDRTVVTYDPRGAGRSRRTDGASETTPDEHADDLHRLIRALDARPVDVFASSGGAVNALALVARHPEHVRTLVAHEPPARPELPDRDVVPAACVDIRTRIVIGVGADSGGVLAPARPSPWPNAGRRARHLSRAHTPGSSVVSTARLATRTPSPPPCARSSPAEGVAAARRRRGEASDDVGLGGLERTVDPEGRPSRCATASERRSRAAASESAVKMGRISAPNSPC